MNRRNRSKLVGNTFAGSPGRSMPTGGKHSPLPLAPSGGASSRGAVMLAAALIVLAIVAAYANSFGGPFVFDDKFSIPENPTIQQLWPIWKTLCPSNGGETVTGRPLLNLSLAVNYAASGLEVWSYHAMNLAIHLAGALLLFDLLRRTFLLPCLRDRWAAVATPAALVIALLWAIHPLQTESVTYVVQRAESLVGLFYLLTLYCFLRGVDSPKVFFWHTGAVLACLLGMASKEVMVSAPLIVLLYDRTLVAGSFREAWRRRYGLYLTLAGTWLLLGWLVVLAGNRGGSAGLGVGISPAAYLGTQFGAIVHYLRLCVWPHPLLLDYGTSIAHGALEIVPYAILVGLLGIATVVALWRWPKLGFLGACFFALLAPTSSVVPVATQTIAEHRMYLPLAAVVTGLVGGGFVAGRWLLRRRSISLLASQIAGGSLVILVGVTFAVLTFLRNEDYRSDFSIWEDTVAKVPGNARAHNNLGQILAGRGQLGEAIVHYRKALEIEPKFVQAHNNLGAVLVSRGHIDEAIPHFQKALEIEPNYPKAHNNLGAILASRGHIDEAIPHFQKALEIEPNYPEAHNNLSHALASRGRVDEAIASYEKAVEIQPKSAEAHYRLGSLLVGCGQVGEAIVHFEKVLEIAPRDAQAWNNLAWLLATHPKASVRNGVKAVELALQAEKLSGGKNPVILDTLAAAYAEAGRFAEAIATARKARDLATQQKKPALVEPIKARIVLYESGTPFREKPSLPGTPPTQP